MITVKVEKRVGLPPDTKWKVLLDVECVEIPNLSSTLSVLHNLFDKFSHRIIIISDSETNSMTI